MLFWRASASEQVHSFQNFFHFSSVWTVVLKTSVTSIMCTSALSVHQQDQERTTGQLYWAEMDLSLGCCSLPHLHWSCSFFHFHFQCLVCSIAKGTLMVGAVTLIRDWALKGSVPHKNALSNEGFPYQLPDCFCADWAPKKKKKKRMTLHFSSLSRLTSTIYLQVQTTFPVLASISYIVKSERHSSNILFLMWGATLISACSNF